MDFSKKRKYLVFVGSTLLFLFVLILVVNNVLGTFIKKKINEPKITENSIYHLSVENVSTNLLLGNVRISNIHLIPDSVKQIKAIAENTQGQVFYKIDITELNLRKFNLIDALLRKKVSIGKIEFTKPKISIYKGEPEVIITEHTKIFSLDSIQLKGLEGIDLGDIVLTQSNISIINLVSSDTIISTEANTIKVKGIDLQQLASNKNYLKLDLSKFSFEVKDKKSILPGGNYSMHLKHLYFKADLGELILDNLHLAPRDVDVYKLAKKLHYASEIYTINIGSVKLKLNHLIESIKNKCFYTDSLKISELDLSILMDKSLPLNLNKRPQLPHQLLKNMEFPLYIGDINIENSNLNYQEKMPNFKEPMTVTLNNLDVKIKRVTSVKDSLKVRQNMTIKLQSDFMNTAKMQIDFVFPLYATADTFFYSGYLGSAPFPAFNKATVPALGAKFNDGQLQSINFKGSANSVINTGEFTMLYHDLIAEISRKDYHTKNKLLSWAANTALLNSNPGKNRKTRSAIMQSERNINKGFGNFMWKTFQNGIVSTVLPTGKMEKTEHNKKKKKRN